MLFVIILIASTLFWACGEDEEPDCAVGEIVERVDKGEGSIYFSKEYSGHIIIYKSQNPARGVISGLICSNAFPHFLITDTTTVLFSGKFREIPPEYLTAQRIEIEPFILELSFLAAK